jgi:hypothetical protein
MVDETLTQRLDALLEQSKDSAAAGRELHRMLHDSGLQGNPEVERWFTREMAKQEFVKLRLAALNAPNDMHKKCAGLALVKKVQATEGLTQHERVEELTKIVRAPGLHADARVEAVKALDHELASTTGGMERLRIIKVLLLELGGAPQPLKEAVAEAFAECALAVGGNPYTVKRIILSGQYGEAMCERIGRKLIDMYVGKGNAGDVELIADDPKTPYKVVAYACAKLGRPVPEPPAMKADDDTMMGPLARWLDRTKGAERAKAANGAPDGGTPNGGKPKVPIRR